MSAHDIYFKGKPILPAKASVNPDIRSKTVLVGDAWEYVSLWLRRHSARGASFHWTQAKNFIEATRELPKEAAPLTSYYAFLNAVKALLITKNVGFSEAHGSHPKNSGKRSSLLTETLMFEGRGVLAGLVTYLGEDSQSAEYRIKDLLKNLPYVHRAYKLTYSSEVELFMPLTRPRFVRMEGSDKAWFMAEVSDPQYHTKAFLDRVPSELEIFKPKGGRGEGVLAPKPIEVRFRSRFRWKDGAASMASNKLSLAQYQAKVRPHIEYIAGTARLWYLKLSNSTRGHIRRSLLTLAYAVMHWLSDLARYDPERLQRHFGCQHNFLLSEFIQLSPYQFMDRVACEITGHEFLPPGYRSAL